MKPAFLVHVFRQNHMIGHKKRSQSERQLGLSLGALAGDRHRSTTTSDIGAFFNANLGGKVWHLIHLISGGTF